MKLHSVVRIGLVFLMLVGAFIAGQRYSRTAAAQSPQKSGYQIVGCGVGCSRSSSALPQELRVIRVGVPVMKNNASRSVPDLHARDRLVKAFNDEKPDKKLHVRVQGVPLDGTNPDDVASQGAAKNCDYVVYTTLIELLTQGDPVERRPGTIEINPGAKRGAQDPESEAMNPEYRATVEYKLYRTGIPSAISGAPFSTEKAMSEMNAVSQVIDRIANSVFADVKKRYNGPSITGDCTVGQNRIGQGSQPGFRVQNSFTSMTEDSVFACGITRLPEFSTPDKFYKGRSQEEKHLLRLKFSLLRSPLERTRSVLACRPMNSVAGRYDPAVWVFCTSGLMLTVIAPSLSFAAKYFLICGRHHEQERG